MLWIKAVTVCLRGSKGQFGSSPFTAVSSFGGAVPILPTVSVQASVVAAWPS